jgi:hypothetical protein
MHRGHDHDHGHQGGGAADWPPAGPGHNHAMPRQPAAQWQTPHREGREPAPDDQGEPDLDLVEAAFVEAFVVAGDPTSFLRLARIPFETTAADGTRLVLLRVEIEAVTDVGGIAPHLGGASFRYDPLPAKITSRRRRLRFAYFDGREMRMLGLPQVRALGPAD